NSYGKVGFTFFRQADYFQGLVLIDDERFVLSDPSLEGFPPCSVVAWFSQSFGKFKERYAPSGCCSQLFWSDVEVETSFPIRVKGVRCFCPQRVCYVSVDFEAGAGVVDVADSYNKRFIDPGTASRRSIDEEFGDIRGYGWFD